jgi:hypothetical protein
VIIAQYFRQFPAFLIQDPEVGKPCSAGPIVFFIFFSDVKMVDASLNGSVEFTIRIQWKNVQAFCVDFPDGFFVTRATDIVCGIFQEFSFVLEAALVMVKAQVVCHLIFQVV